MKSIIKISAFFIAMLFMFYLLGAMFALNITWDSLTDSEAPQVKYGEISRVSDVKPESNYPDIEKVIPPGGDK